MARQGRQNGFESGVSVKHWQVLSATMIGRPEKFFNSRRSRMAKTVTFWPWWQPFNSFCLKVVLFFLCFPFFYLLCKKVGKAWSARLPQYRRLCETLVFISYMLSNVPNVWIKKLMWFPGWNLWTFRLIRINELIYFVDSIILLTNRSIIANIKF